MCAEASVSREDDKPMPTPRSASDRPGGEAENLSVKDAALRLEDIANLYDENYHEITEILGIIADTTEETRAHRTEKVSELKDDLKNWLDRVEKAKLKSLDTASLEERRRYVRELEIEKKDLVQEIVAGNQQTDELKQKREQLETKINNVQRDIDRLKLRRASDIPSLEFVMKVYRKLSGVKVVPTDDPNKLQGFVSKPESHDVIPFQYDRKLPAFQRVNGLWDLMA